MSVLSSRGVLSMTLAAAFGCAPSQPSTRTWADVPMGGLWQQDQTSLADLVKDPAAYQGKTIRANLRVVEARRDARGVWLRVVPSEAPLGAAGYVMLLVPKDAGGDEYLDFHGRDLDLVMEVVGPTATMAYENAFIVKPIAHVSRFVPSSRGDSEAAEVQRQLETGASVVPAEPQ